MSEGTPFDSRLMTAADWEAKRRDDDEFRRLISALQDPMGEASYCAHALSIALQAWELYGEQAANDPDRVELLRSVVKFLTVSRSPQERAAIKTRLSTCGCRGALSRFRTTPPTLYYEKALMELCSIVYTALEPLCAGKFRKRKKNVPASAQPWPHSVDDLFQGNQACDRVLYSLMGWADNGSGGYGAFTAIASLVVYWEPFAREIFKQPVMASAARKLTLGYESYVETNNPGDPFFVWPVAACAERFLHSLSRFPPAESMTALLPSYQELYVASTKINPVLGSRFRLAAQWFDTIIDFQPTYALASSNPNVVIRLTGEEGHEAVYPCMTQIRNNNRCMNVECTAPLGTRTTACARCAVVRYCGKQCQRLAWKADNHPHRTLCKDVHALRCKLELLDPGEWDSWVFWETRSTGNNGASFDKLCQSKNVDRALSDSIHRQIKGLQQLGKHPTLANERFRW
ncbi:hypothetical protein B0H11DRAFT_2035545 [Mycena galericulata]|nr:hypothetical protein B0H11DRAFT_2035545 [Mycena galericulata]